MLARRWGENAGCGCCGLGMQGQGEGPSGGKVSQMRGGSCVTPEVTDAPELTLKFTLKWLVLPDVSFT